MSRTQRWTFTVPNPDTWRPTFDCSSMSYLVWEMETCPTTGTPHIQGYVRMTTRKTLNTMRTLLHPNVHLEPARGTEEENKTYCSKDRAAAGLDWGEEGQYDPTMRQGRRSDLKAATDAIASGATKKTLAQDFPEVYAKYGGNLDKMISLSAPPPPRLRTLTTTILWGQPGTGKTWRVYNQFEDCYFVKPGRDPWGSYDGQATICFDEFDDTLWPVTDMNTYLDIYRCELNCRYSNKWAYWTRVFIISNIDPATFYMFTRESQRAAFHRRITNTVEVLNQAQVIDLNEIPTQMIFD